MSEQDGAASLVRSDALFAIRRKSDGTMMGFDGDNEMWLPVATWDDPDLSVTKEQEVVRIVANIALCVKTHGKEP